MYTFKKKKKVPFAAWICGMLQSTINKTREMLSTNEKAVMPVACSFLSLISAT